MNSQLIPGIPDDLSKKIFQLFSSESREVQFILFGSRAKGNFREGSDIDIAIKGKQVTLADRSQWLSKYEDLNLPWKLDLIIYDLIQEPALKDHIDRVGKCLIQT
jgi:predicted nucleotidyltransferase